MFDYIVVGAGSAGCACAARLIDLLPDDARVALIESGQDFLGPTSSSARTSDDNDFSIAERFARTWAGPANKGYRTVPQKALNDRRLSIVRAEAIGGCSTVNALIWTRGFKQDWDDHMSPGFRGDDIEEEFEWLEGRIEPVAHEGNFIGEKGVKAAEALGYERIQSGSSLWEKPGAANSTRISIDSRGRRQDVYRALGACDDRITLIKGLAQTLIFEQRPDSGEVKGHAGESGGDKSEKSTTYVSGVKLRMEDGSIKDVMIKDGGEVIISCGAIDSPKLLQLSGIGPRHLLDKLGIPLILDSPGVGEGLKDHMMYPILYEIHALPENLSPNALNATLYDESLDVQFLICDGKVTPSHLSILFLEPLKERIPSNNILGKTKNAIVFMGMSLLSSVIGTLAEWIPAFHTKIQTNATILVNLMNPASSGRVMIVSKDPNDAPMIDVGYLSDERDMDTLAKGVAKAVKLFGTSPFSEVVGKELTPPVLGGGGIRENIKKNAVPYHHSTGTCASCLDDRLCFRGIAGLRVADASSLPFHPRAPTNASSMAVGARCASFIAAKYKM